MNIYRQTLHKYWGYTAFRPLQEDIILSVAEHQKDTLGLLPTGGGKSLIFQVPAMVAEGVCIVITPLIALMKDQVENLKKRQIPAVAIYTGMTRDEIDIVLNNAVYNAYKFLYVSPERLSTDIFKQRVQDMKVSYIVIDEAHCISQWGYDFRPSYLKISEIRTLLPNIPVLALTATATPEVVTDIQHKLGFKTLNVFKKSFSRENLIYIVRKVENKEDYLLKIISKMQNACGVVYVRSRKRTFEIAQFLVKNGHSADFYHAGLKNEIKDQKQLAWKKDKTHIMVATNAFGMGIDKPDVRFVVHMDVPESPEAYFQEAGRGGRDEKTAYAVLLYHNEDKIRLKSNLTRSFPDRNDIRKIYDAIGNYYQLPIGAGKGSVFDFDVFDFVSRYKLSIYSVYSALSILQQEGYVEVTDELNNPSLLRFLVGRDDLYKFQVANVKFDNFIKLVLRSYTGLFTEYAKINEEFLARHSNSTREIVYEYLQRLAKFGIVKYIPQRKSPLLIFHEERLDARSLVISKAAYEDRKLRAEKRIDAMIAYADGTAVCRSSALLAYFGETDAKPCGKCDVCQSKNENTLTAEQYKAIELAVINQLKAAPVALDKISDVITVKGATQQKILQVIREMTDREQLLVKENYLHLP